jgi:hypothetical protein
VSRIISSVSLSALSWTVCSVFPRQSPVWLPAFSCTVHSLQNVPSMMTSRALYITWLNFSGDNFSHLCRYLPRPISTRFNMRSHFHDTRLTIQAFLFASLLSFGHILATSSAPLECKPPHYCTHVTSDVAGG